MLNRWLAGSEDLFTCSPIYTVSLGSKCITFYVTRFLSGRLYLMLTCVLPGVASPQCVEIKCIARKTGTLIRVGFTHIYFHDVTIYLKPKHRVVRDYWTHDISVCFLLNQYNLVHDFNRVNRPICSFQGLYSLSGKTSYRQISWSLEAARLGVAMVVSLWNLTGTSAAVLPRYLPNFRAIGKV